jgi:D-alanine-D-alanine ligase
MSGTQDSRLKTQDLGTLKAAVLCGGIGEERQVSLESGCCAYEALKRAGVDSILADVQPDKLDILNDNSIDVFFLALHGRFGEDGQLQQILEEKNLLYTGSGPEASRMAFDKMASKKAFAAAGISTPAAIEFSTAHTNMQELEKKLQQLADKYVIKPVRQGSSVGVSIVEGAKEALQMAYKCSREFGDCMIEKFIPGRLVTVGVLCDQTLPIIEVRTKRAFYDYQAKYLDKHTEYIFDTIADEAVAAKVNSAALACLKALRLQDFARIDLILNDDNIAYVLEANTIPGLTSHSLLPMAAAKAGMSMSELCVRIIESAITRKTIKVREQK